MSRPCVGVASLIQETNTFALGNTDRDAFAFVQGNTDVSAEIAGTNTEIAGALTALSRRGLEPVALVHGWAMSGPMLSRKALGGLVDDLLSEIHRSRPLDGLVLCLHGALISEDRQSADAVLIEACRSALPNAVIGASFDLHANLTNAIARSCDFFVGYHTYPHVDQALTGSRVADLVTRTLVEGDLFQSVVRRLPMLIPPEAEGEAGAFGALRELADALTTGNVVDVSLFPVQPWLDVPDLASAVSVTVVGSDSRSVADDCARRVAEAWWRRRHDFVPRLVKAESAIEEALRNPCRPVLLSESFDSPTAGAPGDSTTVLGAVLAHGGELTALITVVDPSAAAACHEAGLGADVSLPLGASRDRRFSSPIEVAGRVERCGSEPLTLSGPYMRGSTYSMGRFAVIRIGGTCILVTEKPAPTFDPQCFFHAGLDPAEFDIVVVKSANLFRAGWAPISSEAIFVEGRGVSSPDLRSLEFEHVVRPIFPTDDDAALAEYV
jgi:microcystin degradation protein MlrC